MHEKFVKIEAEVDGATAGMTEDQFRFRPRGKWSSADILQHLALTYGGTAKSFRKRIIDGPQGGTPTAKQRIAHLLVLEMGVFPFKRKSPEPVAPKADMGGTEALQLLKQNLREMDTAFSEFQAKHGSSGRVANHPILGPLTYEQWPKFHLNHARHHLKQINLLRAAAAREIGPNKD